MANDRHTMFFMGKEYPNVAMGGGSGGGMSATELYTATEFASVIELSDDITNYDFIALHAETSAGGLLWEKSEIYYVPSLANGDRIGFADDGSYSWYSITDSDTITFELSGDNRYYIKSVVGLKSSSGGGGGGSEVEPNPQGTPTDTLNTIGINGTIYDIAGGGEPTKTLVYQLGAGGRWETFSNPHSSKKLLVEAEGYGIVRGGEFEPTLLPAREGGDNYVTIANTPVGNLAINLGQMGSGETIYISTNGGYDTNIQTVRVYKLD